MLKLIKCLFRKHRWGEYENSWMLDTLYKIDGVFLWQPIRQRFCERCGKVDWHFYKWN